MSVKTRKKDAPAFLRVVEEIPRITGSKLPSRGQALGRMLHRMHEWKESKREAASAVVLEVLEFWEKAFIPTQEMQHCVVKLEKLHKSWESIKKSAHRASATQTENEVKFSSSVNDLFDIAHKDALTLIKSEEDRQFLIQQRLPGRPGTLGSYDRSQALRLARSAARAEKQEARKRKAEEESSTLFAAVAVLSPDGSAVTAHVEDSSPEECNTTPVIRKVTSERVRKPVNIMTPLLAATLDRVKLSDRSAVFVIAAVARSLGFDLGELAINRTTVRTARLHFRKEIAAELHINFNFEGVLVVHWDGKMLFDLIGKLKIDRLPILVSAGKETKLLCIPKLYSSSGRNEATAVHSALREWRLDDRVSAMSFDTTSSNTGRHIGACVLLEELLDRELLWLACSVVELLIKAAWESLMGPTSAPTVPMFERFRVAWSTFSSHDYSDAMLDPALNASLGDEKERIVSFVRRQLEETQPREDYRELLQLVLVITDAWTETEQYIFRVPGAVSHTRWMAKAIYSLKIYMFRDKFRLTKSESGGLFSFCLYILRVHVEAWFTSPLALSAARSDLSLVHKLLEISASKVRAKANPYKAADKLKEHLWYLSEEQVAMAFYDPEVPVEEKRLMVDALNNRQGAEERKPRLKVEDAALLQYSSRPDFVTTNTWNFFEILGLSKTFLEEDPSLWEDLHGYQTGRGAVKKLQVVNDAAERGVALIEQYNKLHTRDEEQLQFLLQVVEEHRKQYPNSLKRSLL